jgi:hypothetical protein
MHFLIFAQSGSFYWEIAANLQQLPRRGPRDSAIKRSLPGFSTNPTVAWLFIVNERLEEGGLAIARRH